MNKLVRYIQSYLIFGFPFVITAMIWDNSIEGNRFVRLTQELLSWQLALWFSVLIIFLILLVVAPNVREFTLRRLANIKAHHMAFNTITPSLTAIKLSTVLQLLPSPQFWGEGLGMRGFLALRRPKHPHPQPFSRKREKGAAAISA